MSPVWRGPTAASKIVRPSFTCCSASGAIVYGFNVRPEKRAADLASKESIEIRTPTGSGGWGLDELGFAGFTAAAAPVGSPATLAMLIAALAIAMGAFSTRWMR